MAIVTDRKNIEDGLEAIISQAVQDAGGKVHRGQHTARSPEDWMELFKVEKDNTGLYRIHAWEFFRSGIADFRVGTAGVPLNQVRRRHEYTIRGFYGYDPGKSEAEFQEIVDTVMDKLASTVIVGTALRTIAPMCSLDMEMNGDILVHVAEIKYPVEEQVAGL